LIEVEFKSSDAREHVNIEIKGRWPELLRNRISPADSSLVKAALAASRLTQNDLSDNRVSFKGLPLAIPFNHHIAKATFSDLPGRLAALLIQSKGIGPLINSDFLGAETNRPVIASGCNRLTLTALYALGIRYIYI
jgi:hypothetical protein